MVYKRFDLWYKCTVPENISNKALLHLDNPSHHPVNLGDFSGVRAEFIPKTVSSLVQPMDQVVIRNFTAYCIRIFKQFIIAIDRECKPIVRFLEEIQHNECCK